MNDFGLTGLAEGADAPFGLSGLGTVSEAIGDVPRPSPETFKLRQSISRWRPIVSGNADNMEFVPFAGQFLTAARLSTVRQAATRLDRGEATDEDFDRIGRFIATEEAKGDDSWSMQRVRNALGGAQFFSELLATGGLSGAAGNSVKQALTKQIGERLAARVASNVAGVAAAAGVDTALRPGAVLARAEVRQAPQVGFGETADGRTIPTVTPRDETYASSLLKGGAREFLSAGVERGIGEAVGAAWRGLRGAAPVANPSLGRRVASAAGINGIGGELVENRVDETAAGAIGLEDDFGLTGLVAAMSAEAASAGSLDPVRKAAPGVAADLGNELVDTVVQMGMIRGAGKGVEAMTDPGGSLPGILERLKGIPPAVAEKIAAGKPLSRRDAAALGLGRDGKRSTLRDREGIVAEVKAAVAAEADRLIREDPQAALVLAAQEAQGGIARPAQYEQATGGPEPHDGYSQLLFDALKGRQDEIRASFEAKATAASDTDAELDTVSEDAGEVAGFATEHGSTYVIGEGGVTTRNKAARGWHEKGDGGAKETSERTYYVEPDAARAIGDFTALTIPVKGTDQTAKKVIDAAGRKVRLRAVFPDGTEKSYGEFDYSDGPAVGLSPVEEWKGGYGKGGGIHPGSKIVSVDQRRSGPDARINEHRAELNRAGIPIAANETKEELAAKRQSWEDELRQAADEAEVSPERLRFHLERLYEREQEIAGQDGEFEATVSAYRRDFGLNGQAMSKSDLDGSFSGKAFPDIAQRFLSDVGGPRPGLESTQDVWDLFKSGKRTPTTYRALLGEALDHAVAEQGDFDPDAFSDVGDPATDAFVDGMPTIASTGTRIPWKYAGTPGTGRAPSGAAVIGQVLKAAHAFGKASGTAIPLRVGRVRSRKAAGQFDTRQFVARVRQANDSVTATHELGHGIERTLRGREPWENLVPLEVLGDLTGLGREAYPKGPPHNGWASEGFAELVMRFVHDPEGLAKNYRHAAGWFQATVLAGNPKGAKHLRAASRLGVRYRDAGSVGRGLSTTVRSGSAEDLGIKLAQGRRRLNLKERYVEAGEPLRDAAGRFAVKRGEPLAADENPFELFKANRLTAPAVLRTAVLEAPVDARGVPVPGKRPLADIARHVSDRDLPKFELYLKALRTIAEKTKGEGRDTGLSLKDAEQIVRELKSPAFDAAAAVYYGFDDWGLDYLAEHSETLADVRDAIRKKDPGNHAPLRRIWESFEDPPEAGRSTSRTADARVGGRFKGSGRRTRPLVDSLIAQVGERIRLAHSRQVLDALVAFVPEKGVPGSGLEGIGELIEEVDPKTVPEYQARVQDVVAKLRTALREQGLDAELFERRTGEKVPLDDVVDDLIPFFGLERNPPGGRHILPVFRKGKVRLFELKPKLLDALKTMDEQPLEGVYGRLFFRALRVFSRVFKFGTVGGRPSFGFIVNPPRDYADWRQRTRTSASEATDLFPTFTKNLFRELLWRATRSEAFDSDAAKFFRRRGLDMATPLGEDSAALRRLADRVAPVKLSEMDGLWSFGRHGRMRAGQFFDYLVDLLQFSDAAVRIGEIELLAKEHGIDLKDPTREQAIFLAIAGKEPTTDFTARGTDTAVVEALFPFFNASVQGTAGGFRAAKRHPFRTLWRFGTAASVGLALWLRNRDEDWWKRLPSYEKWMYLHVGVGDERLRVAVPHDWGNLYAQSLVATVDAVYQRDPEIALDYARQWVELQAPSLNPMLGEPWQQATNVDSFTGAPLVPQGLARRPAEQQTGEYTSEAAKFLGEGLGWSPMRIDHAIRGVGGPLAGDVLQGVGLGFEDAREREPADLPVIGRLFARGGLQGSRPAPVDRVYELKERADLEKYRAEATGGETAAQAELRLMLSQTADELTALSKARTSTKGLTERRAITVKMAEIAEAAVATWRAATPRRGVYRSAEVRARRTATPAGA